MVKKKYSIRLEEDLVNAVLSSANSDLTKTKKNITEVFEISLRKFLGEESNSENTLKNIQKNLDTTLFFQSAILESLGDPNKTVDAILESSEDLNNYFDSNMKKIKESKNNYFKGKKNRSN